MRDKSNMAGSKLRGVKAPPLKPVSFDEPTIPTQEAPSYTNQPYSPDTGTDADHEDNYGTWEDHSKPNDGE